MCLHNTFNLTVAHVTYRTKASGKQHSRVKSVIAGLALAGNVSLETAAKHLGTSPRTVSGVKSTYLFLG